MRWETRVARGGDPGLSGSGSGSGRVRARATLQAFAPRSRTCGKWRLMSWNAGHKQLTSTAHPNHSRDYSRKHSYK